MSFQKLVIREWAESDRPREKLLEHGRRSVSDAELLAILIRSGSKNETAVELCKRLLNSVNNNLFNLSKLEVNDLCQFKALLQLWKSEGEDRTQKWRKSLY